MQLSMKCSVAVHCLIFIHEAEGLGKVTSNILSQSTGCNAVIIRNTLGALKKAGLVQVARGTGGTTLAKSPKDITLYDIYHALEPNGLCGIIGIHACSDRPCPVAQNIADVLHTPYRAIEENIQTSMEHITLQQLLDDYHRHAPTTPTS